MALRGLMFFRCSKYIALECINYLLNVLSTAFVLQVVSGAPLTAFWGATYLWDFINFLVPVAGPPSMHDLQSTACLVVTQQPAQPACLPLERVHPCNQALHAAAS